MQQREPSARARSPPISAFNFDCSMPQCSAECSSATASSIAFLLPRSKLRTGQGRGRPCGGGAELNFREGALEALKVVQSCCQREKECSSDQWAASMNSRRFAHHSDESTGGGGKWGERRRI